MNCAVLGFGTVGSGVCEVLTGHAGRISHAVGEEICLKHILDLREFPGNPLETLLTKNFEDILNDASVEIVAECLGGTTFAYDYTKRLLKAGKNVVTSNKDLVAAHGAELLTLAKDNGVRYLFEAAVGGGVPIIRPLRKDLAANNYVLLYGILNGTTNYVLTAMEESNAELSQALKEAQALGYAEANPSSDIDGKDTANKICILASLAFGKHIYPSDIPVTGIRSVAYEDIELAHSAGYRIKLIGRATLAEDDSAYVTVAPELVPEAHQLAGIRGVNNGIMVRGDLTGDVFFAGRGAGKFPTASAVVSDIMECASPLTEKLPLFWEDNGTVSEGSEIESEWYIRTEKPADPSIFGEFRMISASSFITGKLEYHNFRRIMDIYSKEAVVINAFRILN